MKKLILFSFFSILSLSFFPSAFAQETIVIDAQPPCFLNNTAGVNIWKLCGADDDFIQFALMPFEYATGGFFTMILVFLLIIISYLKYHKLAYPLITSILLFPVAYFLFPSTYVTFAMVIAAISVCILLYFTFIRQTRDR